MSRYDANILKRNPCVLNAKVNSITLKYSFRVRLFELWKKGDVEQMARTLSENGLGTEATGPKYFGEIVRQFRMGGFPMADPKEMSGKADIPEQNPLILSGKFEWCNNKTGIRIKQSFMQELAATFPEVSVEDGLIQAGIDPLDAGYLRIRNIKIAVRGKDAPSAQVQAEAASFTEKDLALMEVHPYTDGVQGSRVILNKSFFNNACPLSSMGMSELLDVFELPPGWFPAQERILIGAKLREWVPTEAGELPVSPMLLRIEGNRERAMAALLAEGFEGIRKLLSGADNGARRRLCRRVKEMPKDPWGYYTVRKVLEKIGMAKSTYYELLGNEEYGRGRERREEREREDLELVRQTAEYKGYAKGYRQVYMMLEQVTGRTLSLNRVRTLMGKHGLNSGIRRPSKNRKAIRELMERNGKPNLLERNFRAYRPNEIRLTDVTYLDCADGLRAYGSASVDPVTGKLICFIVSESNDLQMALDTLAAMDSHPAASGGILHSDQGILYFSDDFQSEVTMRGLIQSMSRRGNCWDNAPQESFFGHFKDECPYKNCRDLEELRSVVDQYRVYYNDERHMWSRGRMTPSAYERYLEGMSEEQFAAYVEEKEEEYRQMREAAATKARGAARRRKQAASEALGRKKNEAG